MLLNREWERRPRRWKSGLRFIVFGILLFVVTETCSTLTLFIHVPALLMIPLGFFGIPVALASIVFGFYQRRDFARWHNGRYL